MALSESCLISTLKKAFPEYIGDDAAVIKPSQGSHWVITKDILVEHRHFELAYVPPDSLACKALQSNLSDLAAMGAMPQFILLGIGAPSGQSSYVSAFIQAFARICQENKVILIGGDTTGSQTDLFISVTAIGTAKIDQVKYRDTASAGELIGLIGQCGMAHLGRLLLEKKEKRYRAYQNAFLYPKAKVAIGAWLAKQQAVSSLMDCSDGLAIDLHRLCGQSNVGAQLTLSALPKIDDFDAVCDLCDCDPVETLLTGGEDYSLLCTIKPEQQPTLARQLLTEFGERLHIIGKLFAGQGLTYVDKGRIVNKQYLPFSHFNEIDKI